MRAAILAAGVIGDDFAKIGDGALRIFDPHARRNRAKAALTSSSLAASPARPSSIAANSSGVASYSAPASSASIFERNLCQLLLPVFQPGRDSFQYCLNLILGHESYPILVGPFPTMRQRSMPPMQRYLTSRNSSMPYFEPSRPMPLSFMPPKGAISVEMMPSLMPTMPYSSASAMRQMRPMSRL
jgi:hypothetical protein